MTRMKKNIKKDILLLLGVLGGITLATVTKGVAMPALLSVLTTMGGSLGINSITKLSPARVKNWFKKFHPNQLNHSVKRLFVKSVNEALYNIYVLFKETQASDKEKKEARQLIQILQKNLPDMLMDSDKMSLDEPEIKHFLYEKDKDDSICDFIKNQFGTFGITEPFQSFLAQHLPAQLQLCFGEGLKDPDNHNAWVAFQRMLMEEIRSDIKQIADTQQSIKDDLSDLKFEKSGFSEEQIAEIRQLIKILNDKKLIEVKIKDGINQSLESIENKANEIIRITTKTQLTVDELKTVVEKIKRQNHTNHLIIYVLTACLLAAGIFVAYKIVNQPFTTTVKVYGWEGEQHNPLEGKGSIVLILGDKTEKAEINRQGEAVFKGILPEYNGQRVAVFIADTEGEPYFLSDSLVKIQKNGMTKVQVLLRGLEKLHGTIYDFNTDIGLQNVTIRIAGIETLTDEWGHFSIDIPLEKQKKKQEVEFLKHGYESQRFDYDMTGENPIRFNMKQLQ